MARCDCLNDCGDDPWLKDGRAVACDHLVEVRRVAALRDGIVVKQAAFSASGTSMTVVYAVPLNVEQQAMVLPVVP